MNIETHFLFFNVYLIIENVIEEVINYFRWILREMFLLFQKQYVLQTKNEIFTISLYYIAD